jgi:7-cyano-7-deazaguanine synthase
MKSAVVLLSGGVDSTTLLHYVRRELGDGALYALSFLYGQKHARELEMARWQARAAGVAEHREIDIGCFAALTAGGSALTDAAIAVPDMAAVPPDSLSQPPTYVPNRNMVLLALAAAYAESRGVSDLYYGAQAQDRYGYWDCTVDFVDRINDVLGLNRGRAVTIHAPFASRRKADVVRIGMELGVDYTHTWTCYRGGVEPCGTCPSCVERADAFKQARSEEGL